MTRTIWTICSLVLLGSCSPAVVDTSCTAFSLIPYHAPADAAKPADTPDTIQRIREHNAAWRRLCGP